MSGESDSIDKLEIRRAVAAVRELSQIQRNLAQHYLGLAKLGVSESLVMHDQARDAAQVLEHLASLHAEFALTYATMIRAGDPDNSHAADDYEMGLQRLIDLFPVNTLGKL